MRLPVHTSSSPLITPSLLKSKSSAPTLAKLPAPVGVPLMIRLGVAGALIERCVVRSLHAAPRSETAASTVNDLQRVMRSCPDPYIYGWSHERTRTRERRN